MFHVFGKPPLRQPTPSAALPNVRPSLHPLPRTRPLIAGVSLDSTQIYNEVAIKTLKEAHARTHPSQRRMKLEETRNTVMLNIMNAAEIIREIARLPDTEQGKVVEFVRHLTNAQMIAAIHEPLEEGSSFKSATELFAAIDEEA